MISTLMVSRDKSFFAGMESTFAENGIKTDWSSSGKKALSMLTEKSIDLLIIDEKLPILMEIPFDKRIAQIYSNGELIAGALPGYRAKFQALFEKIVRVVENGGPN